MEPNDLKIVLVTRRTRLQELVARYNTVEQARFQAEHLGMDFGDFLEEDRNYRVAVDAVNTVLQPHGRLQQLDRGFLPNFLFPRGCLVVVLGQDGLVANTLKYLDGQSVLALNPDPARWEGVLLPFQVDDVSKVLPEVVRQERPIREITMARATLGDGQTLLAVNDLFIGMRSHVSARYEIALGDRKERQSSSGIIVSTGLGSTGWLRSILTGAHAVAGRDASKEMSRIDDHCSAVSLWEGSDRGGRANARRLGARGAYPQGSCCLQESPTLQGRTFTWEIPADCGPGLNGYCFDPFGRPTKVTKSSSP